MMAEFIDVNIWEKACSKCKTTYSAKTKFDLTDYFYNDKSRRDLLSLKCKKCFKQPRPRTPEENARARAKFPHKVAARALLNNAIASGSITKPKTCQVCSVESRIHGHHTDYNQPLNVMWLCSICHGRQHRLEARTLCST